MRSPCAHYPEPITLGADSRSVQHLNGQEFICRGQANHVGRIGKKLSYLQQEVLHLIEDAKAYARASEQPLSIDRPSFPATFQQLQTSQLRPLCPAP